MASGTRMKLNAINSFLYRYGSIIAALLGAMYFFILLGWRILNPVDISWLAGWTDVFQPFVGFHYFRQSPWTFPPGIIEGYGL